MKGSEDEENTAGRGNNKCKGSHASRNLRHLSMSGIEGTHYGGGWIAGGRLQEGIGCPANFQLPYSLPASTMRLEMLKRDFNRFLLSRNGHVTQLQPKQSKGKYASRKTFLLLVKWTDAASTFLSIFFQPEFKCDT